MAGRRGRVGAVRPVAVRGQPEVTDGLEPAGAGADAPAERADQVLAGVGQPAAADGSSRLTAVSSPDASASIASSHSSLATGSSTRTRSISS